MKTIALIHYAYPPNVGGVERLMSEQARILAGLGYVVKILTGSGASDTSSIEVIEVSQLRAVRKFNPALQERIFGGLPPDSESEQLATDIGQLLESTLARVDVIIVHNMLTLVHNLPFIKAFKAFASRHPEKKVLVWTHDQTFIDNGRVVWEKPGVALHDDFKQLLLTPLSGARYVVISETFKALLFQVMPMDSSGLTVIPNGINIRKFLEIDPVVWRMVRDHKLLEAFPLILAPVNVLERKNLDYGLDIVTTLRSRYPHIRLLVSGMGSKHRDTSGYEQRLKKRIAEAGLTDTVLFLGEIVGRGMTDAELHDLYDLADIIFYFSRQENFGLPILEAGLSKTPIWVSELPVFTEISGGSVTVIKDGQTAAVTAKQLDTFLSSDTTIALKKRVRTNYNLESIITDRLLPLIEGK